MKRAEELETIVDGIIVKISKTHMARLREAVRTLLDHGVTPSEIQLRYRHRHDRTSLMDCVIEALLIEWVKEINANPNQPRYVEHNCAECGSMALLTVTQATGHPYLCVRCRKSV